MLRSSQEAFSNETQPVCNWSHVILCMRESRECCHVSPRSYTILSWLSRCLPKWSWTFLRPGFSKNPACTISHSHNRRNATSHPNINLSEDAFLKVNSDRGLLVLGAAKPEPAPKGRSKKVLKKEIQESRQLLCN